MQGGGGAVGAGAEGRTGAQGRQSARRGGVGRTRGGQGPRLTCQWKRSEPAGPAEHSEGGSLPRSASSLEMRFRAIVLPVCSSSRELWMRAEWQRQSLAEGLAQTKRLGAVRGAHGKQPHNVEAGIGAGQWPLVRCVLGAATDLGAVTGAAGCTGAAPRPPHSLSLSVSSGVPVISRRWLEPSSPGL